VATIFCVEMESCARIIFECRLVSANLGIRSGVTRRDRVAQKFAAMDYAYPTLYVDLLLTCANIPLPHLLGKNITFDNGHITQDNIGCLLVHLTDDASKEIYSITLSRHKTWLVSPSHSGSQTFLSIFRYMC